MQADRSRYKRLTTCSRAFGPHLYYKNYIRSQIIQKDMNIYRSIYLKILILIPIVELMQIDWMLEIILAQSNDSLR